ncbi:family 43 glycosylhydrolase [Wenyingzhuangia marina]|uniref:Arabinan endo-1,5-alpha-L-arabinosidase n=1 Tax=Wenyingzhuangia marina TaxID=1195760 RepID=A0A1M5VKD8_9FLAO|nr:family 43 glycosylhydrolase [Wenyingzhuangia marina]GGF71583.1 hypothetical protein GCM10011397_13140 [Wenyingzhuangia marina]SHH75691.1 arabinan endo-1,5-alpha-L-arabinosidase [Wenyingzhuangia marina]
MIKKYVLNYLNFKLKIIFLIFFCFPLFYSAFAQDWPEGLHDPSNIVKDGDRYWIFATGDGIHAMYSYDLITWQNGPSPFTKTEFPEWINSYVKGGTNNDGDAVFHGAFWAPDIIKMNGRYYLYYSCSEWGTMTSTIGCVSTKSLNPDSPDYNWVDAGFLGIWSYQPGLALNAIDPALTRGHDNKIWMTYGSFNERGMVVTEIDSISGIPKNYSGNLPGKTIANSFTGPNTGVYFEGEGATMIYRDGYYYIFYNKGGCCNGIASSYYVIMGRSESAKGPFVDKEGKPLVTYGTPSGGTLFFKHDDARGLEDRYYGPGHIGIYSEGGVDYVSFHYYDPKGYYPSEEANNMGGPTLGFGKLDWGSDGWPSLSLDFLSEGTYTLENVNSNKFLDVENHIVDEGALLWQHNKDENQASQKWIFTPLGTGEYVIQNSKNKDFYLEAVDGSENGDVLQLTNNYTGAINQKFRVQKSPVNNKLVIYPSIQNTILEIPFAYTYETQVKLYQNTNCDCQRWYATAVDEDLSAAISKVKTIDIFPNPVKTDLNIAGTTPLIRVEIYDNIGKIVETYNPKNATNYTIDFSKFHSGIYHVKLISPRGITYKKILK